jgi:PIN domain nuclease of toxin-antitoxin system
LKRLLVDTHVLLWWLADDPALPEQARAMIGKSTTEALVSVASLWEIAIKRRLGKLEAPESLPETVVTEGFQWLPIEPEHAWAVASLPVHHRDPFDRLLIAQGLAEGLPIVTGDHRFDDYGVEVCW